MPSLRTIILILLALTGLAIGALFVFSMDQEKNFATVEINGFSVMAEVASHRAAWARGLSGREPLTDKEAMLFVFDGPDRYGIWMRDMRFPIDIFWIRNGVIADIEENAPVPAPGTLERDLPVYRPDNPAELVLETSAGFARRHSVRIGDRVRISGDVGRGLAPGISDAQAPPGEVFTIDALRKSPVRGKDLRIGVAVSTTEGYQKFPITYAAGTLTLTGIMNVPYGPVPETGFPVLILNHGLIDPAIYTSGRGSRREQDFFVRHSYVTIHPDYRGYATSTAKISAGTESESVHESAAITWPWYGANPAFPKHHDFYVGYTSDVMALIDAIKNYKGTLIDKNRIGMWGHSMGGGVATRIMTLSPDIKAYVLFGSISANAEENFYEFTPEETAWLRETYGKEGSEIYRRISPITYFTDVQSPVQLHHGTADRDVPIAFSQTMFDTLTALNKKAEFFIYPGEGHEFGDAWQTAAYRALQFFDRYVKNTQ